MTTTTEYTITSEDRVTIDDDGTIRTYTRGCSAPLYVGTDQDAAADSLEIDREMFADALMSDGN